MAKSSTLLAVLTILACSPPAAQGGWAPQRPQAPAATIAAPRPRLPGRWWRDETLARTLALSADQIRKIDKTFEDFLPGQRERWNAFRPLEKELDALLHEPRPDEATVIDRISRVEALRSELNRHRLIMLFRIQQILTAAQRRKLEELGWPNTAGRRP